MKILKLHNCNSKCEHFIINRFLLLITFECSNPLAKKDGFNRELVGKELKVDFPSWCPLEDYKPRKVM